MITAQVSPQPEMRRDRKPILGLPKKAPVPIIAQLGGIEQVEHSDEEAEAQRLEAWLCAQRNRWDIDRRRAGHIIDRKISKADADHLLRRALRALEGGAR